MASETGSPADPVANANDALFTAYDEWQRRHRPGFRSDAPQTIIEVWRVYRVRMLLLLVALAAAYIALPVWQMQRVIWSNDEANQDRSVAIDALGDAVRKIDRTSDVAAAVGLNTSYRLFCTLRAGFTDPRARILAPEDRARLIDAVCLTPLPPGVSATNFDRLVERRTSDWFAEVVAADGMPNEPS